MWCLVRVSQPHFILCMVQHLLTAAEVLTLQLSVFSFRHRRSLWYLYAAGKRSLSPSFSQLMYSLKCKCWIYFLFLNRLLRSDQHANHQCPIATLQLWSLCLRKWPQTSCLLTVRTLPIKEVRNVNLNNEMTGRECKIDMWYLAVSKESICYYLSFILRVQNSQSRDLQPYCSMSFHPAWTICQKVKQEHTSNHSALK